MKALDVSKVYRFSFTAASLMVLDTVELTHKLLDTNNNVASLSFEDLRRERAVTSKREFSELQLRLTTLSEEELAFLSRSKIEDQRLLCLVAFGRAYDFFRDFIEEVLVEKVSLFDFHLTDRDYLTFVNRKAIDHQELDELADSTKKKVKQVVFKVLEQAGLIDSIKTKNIQMPYIGRAFEQLICKTAPNDLKLLLYTEQRIATI